MKNWCEPRTFARYQECGIQGLTDRSRRPYRYANQPPIQVENFFLNVKREHAGWGAHQISRTLAAPIFPGFQSQLRVRSAQPEREVENPV